MQFRSDWSAIWLYNPRMTSLRHGFEEPGDVQDTRLVVDTIPTLAWSARPDGSAEFFNQRWLDYTGLSAKQALGSGWEVAVHPDDLPRILETFREALKSAKPYEVEGRFRRFDGEFRWFLFRGSPLCDRSGRVAKWYGANTDIEERKRAEDALRASEASLLEAQRLTRTCSWKHEVLSGKVTVSTEGLALYGIEPDDDASSVDFYNRRKHPKDRPEVEQAYAAALLGKTGFELEFRNVALFKASIRKSPWLSPEADMRTLAGCWLVVSTRWSSARRTRTRSGRQPKILLLMLLGCGSTIGGRERASVTSTQLGGGWRAIFCPSWECDRSLRSRPRK